jgi:GNAT superfamily N-acetyltransferase
MKLSDDLILRPVDPDSDVPRIALLSAAVESELNSEEGPSEEAVRATFAWPAHDPRRDRWIVVSREDPQTAVAHALIWKPGNQTDADVSITVSPGCRRQDLWIVLMQKIGERAHELGASSLRVYADETDWEYDNFLRDSGFTPYSAFIELSLLLTVPPEPTELAPGLEITSYDRIEDVELLAQIMTRAYAGQWGHHVTTPDDVSSWLPELRKDGIFILFKNGEAIGTCRAEPPFREPSIPGSTSPTTGIIDAPGVIPEMRPSGLQVPLLVTAMNWLSIRGCSDLRLESWGETESDLERYRLLGFVPTHRSISYRLDL